MAETEVRTEIPKGEQPEPPPIICPYCRARDPIIKVGQYSWNVQRYNPAENDWSSSEYGEGELVTSVLCDKCEMEITAYLLRRDARQKRQAWHVVHDHEIPNRVHETPAKRKHPRYGNVDPEWSMINRGDMSLQQKIDEYTNTLGRMLDERDRRINRKQWNPKGDPQ